MGVLGTWHMNQRAGEEVEGTRLLNCLKSHHLLLALCYGGGSLLSLLSALVVHAEGLEAANGVRGVKGIMTVGVVLLISVYLAGSVVVSRAYWHRAITYARTGQVPTLWKPLPGSTKRRK